MISKARVNIDFAAKMQVKRFRTSIGMPRQHASRVPSFTLAISNSRILLQNQCLSVFQTRHLMTGISRCSRRCHRAPLGVRSRHNRSDDDFKVLLFRLAARMMGNVVGYLWRNGTITHAWQNRHTSTGSRLLLLLLALPSLLTCGVFAAHAEVVPFSSRLNFVFLSKDEELWLGAEAEREVLRQEAGRLLPPSQETVREVEAVTRRLHDVCCTEGLISPQQHFSVHVIDSTIANAFVLPNGAIFVYTGILPFAQTEAGLAAIIGHEISHALARHSAEKIGYVNWLMIVTEFFRGLSDNERGSLAALAEFLAASVLQHLFSLAHSRRCEEEADLMGLHLTARAGYDPRHAAQVWQRMLNAEKGKTGDSDTEVDSGDALSAKQPQSAAATAATAAAATATPASAPSPTPHVATAASGAAAVAATGISSSPSSSTSSLSARARLSELFSTHPCHEHRVISLQQQSVELMDTYNRASEQRCMARGVWDSSERRLGQRSRNPRMRDVLQEEEEEEESVRLAGLAASLMVGEQGQMWREFQQSLQMHV